MADEISNLRESISHAPAQFVNPRMEGPVFLCNRYEKRGPLSVKRLNTCMLDLALDAVGHGCANKLLGTLTWTDDQGVFELAMKVSVNGMMDEGSTIAMVLRNRIEWYASAAGAEYLSTWSKATQAETVDAYTRALAAVERAA